MGEVVRLSNAEIHRPIDDECLRRRRAALRAALMVEIAIAADSPEKYAEVRHELMRLMMRESKRSGKGLRRLMASMHSVCTAAETLVMYGRDDWPADA